MNETEKKRLLLLDLLKVSALLAIQIFHAWEFIFFEDQQIHTATSWVFWPLSFFARSFSLSGQVIASVVFLLFGLTGKTRKYFAMLIPFALTGQILVTLAFLENGHFFENLEWDIYTFIAFSSFLLMISPKTSWAKFIAASLLFLIPPAVWKEIAPEGAIFDILTGRESRWINGSWAIFPWFLLIYAFYNLGGLLREKKIVLDEWFRYERWIWAILIAASTPAWGFYFRTPVGPNFYNFIFHQSTHIFLANFLPFIFVIRISFLQSVRQWTEKQAFLRWISQTMWARYVGLCYMVAVVYLGLAALFDEVFRTVPFVLDAYFLALMPLTEITVRGIITLHTRWLQRGKDPSR